MSAPTVRLPRNSSTSPIADHVLKPLLRAYAFGHISTTGPKVVGLLLALVGRHKDIQKHLSKLQSIVETSIGFDRFPAFCASLVGLYSTLSLLFIAALRSWNLNRLGRRRSFTPIRQVRAARLLAALVASWTTFPMLNRGDARYARSRASSCTSIELSGTVPEPSQINSGANAAYQPGSPDPPLLAGRTLDLTILASVRAVETVIWHSWRRRYGPGSARYTRQSTSLIFRLPPIVAASSSPLIFSASCFCIMWAWFYSPDALPSSYRRWIHQAAGGLHPALVQVLRQARWGAFVYGVDTGGAADTLSPMCEQYGWPHEWADPVKTIPVPCEMVHEGTGRSCHKHKAVKFWRVWLFAMRMYLPLQLLLRVRSPTVAAARRAVTEAARSSAFLAAFTTLFYYGVCLSRTLVGPKVFSENTVSRQAWDSGICVGCGSALCGWSVLIEPPKRREELALFVLPRAASVFLPRRYERKYLNRERAAFAAGVSVLFMLAHENPRHVRGILGTLINTVIS